MLGQLRHYSLDEGRETTRSVLRLFNAYTRLLKFASTIPDRKALVALYACALKCLRGPCLSITSLWPRNYYLD